MAEQVASKDATSAERYYGLAAEAGNEMDRLSTLLADHADDSREVSEWEKGMAARSPRERAQALSALGLDATAGDSSSEYVLRGDPFDPAQMTRARDPHGKEPGRTTNKPVGGVWSSPISVEADESLRSEWADVLGSLDQDMTYTEVRGNRDAVIITVSNEDDVKNLSRVFPSDDPKEPFSFSSARDAGVDAIRARNENGSTLFQRTDSPLYRWDVSSTVWLKPDNLEVGDSYASGAPRCDSCGQWQGNSHTCPSSAFGRSPAVLEGDGRIAADPEPDDYRLSHRAPGPDEDGVADRLDQIGEGNTFPGDALEHPEWFGAEYPETIAQVRLARDPDSMVTIYRAVPPGVTEIHPGDWVALSREYATRESYGALPDGGDAVVISTQVKASTLYSEGSMEEWGFNGENSVNTASGDVGDGGGVNHCPECGQFAGTDHACPDGAPRMAQERQRYQDVYERWSGGMSEGSLVAPAPAVHEAITEYAQTDDGKTWIEATEAQGGNCMESSHAFSKVLRERGIDAQPVLGLREPGRDDSSYHVVTCVHHDGQHVHIDWTGKQFAVSQSDLDAGERLEDDPLAAQNIPTPTAFDPNRVAEAHPLSHEYTWQDRGPGEPGTTSAHPHHPGADLHHPDWPEERTSAIETRPGSHRCDGCGQFASDGHACPQTMRDSVVRDDEGHLLTVHHGSATAFETFDPAFTGTGNDTWGSGFYFTRDESAARGYGEHVTSVTLNITNPIRVDGQRAMHLDDSITFSSEQSAAILRHHPDIYAQPGDEERSNPLGDYSADFWDKEEWTKEEMDQMISEVASDYYDDVTWSNLESVFPGESSAAFRRGVQEVTGHDGVVVDFEDGQHWIAWHPEQIQTAQPAAVDHDVQRCPDCGQFASGSHSCPTRRSQMLAQGYDPANLTERQDFITRFRSEGSANADLLDFVERWTPSKDAVAELREEAARGEWPNVVDAIKGSEMEHPPLYRGMNGLTEESAAMITSLRKGSIIDTRGMASFSPDKDRAGDFGGSGTSLLMRMPSGKKGALRITPLTTIPTQEEWLVSGRLRVTRVFEDKQSQSWDGQTYRHVVVDVEMAEEGAEDTAGSNGAPSPQCPECGQYAGTSHTCPSIKKQMLEGDAQRWRAGFDAEESMAWDTYGSVHHEDLNRKLREGEDLTDTERRIMTALDSSLERAPRTDEPVTVYRGISTQRLRGGEPVGLSAQEWIEQNVTVGEQMTLPGYVSTSLSPDWAGRFAGSRAEYALDGVAFEIETTQGSYRVGGVEEEVLLRRDSTFEVTGVDQDAMLDGRNIPVVRMREVVPAAPEPPAPAVANTDGTPAHALASQPAEPMDFRYMRNKQSLSTDQARGQDFGQAVEPAGRYMVEGVPGGAVPDGWEGGTVRFDKPLHIHWGTGGYGDDDSWKRRLSAHYDGKTGKALSQALRNDGYDAIVTHDKYGTSEVVDLTHLKPSGGSGRKSKGSGSGGGAKWDRRKKYTPKQSYDYGKALEAKYGEGVQVWLGGGPDEDSYVSLSKVFIPKEQRGKGLGKKIMADIVAEADRNGWRMSLTPDGEWGSSVTRLKKFYGEFGFVANKGRAKDYRTQDSMVRQPR